MWDKQMSEKQALDYRTRLIVDHQECENSFKVQRFDFEVEVGLETKTTQICWRGGNLSSRGKIS